jgi:outer membrane immunogenic protein
MKTKTLTTLMLLSALLTVRGVAQIPSGPGPTLPEHATELSYTYSALRTNAPVGGCGCFWNSGGSVELAVPLWRHFSSVTEFSGEHANSIPGNSGTALSLMSALAGVRVTRPVNKKFILFAQGLIGVVHAFDSYFPGSSGPTTSATSFALATGGGIEVAVSPRWLVRPVQVEYQFMHLPNNAGNEQHDIRLSAGIALRFFRNSSRN